MAQLGVARDWTASASLRVLLTTVAWWAFFGLVAFVELMVATAQARMSTVLYVDGVAVALLAVAYTWEIAAVWRVVRHTRSPAIVRASAAQPPDAVSPLASQIMWPSVVRNALGRVCMWVIGPVAIMLWASEVMDKTYNLVVDGFVASVLAVHVGVLVQEGILSPLAGLWTQWRLKAAVKAGRMRTLVVVTYNVSQWRGVDGRVDVTQAVAAVQACQPDIVALQDVGCDDGEEQNEQLRQVAEALHMSLCTAPASIVDSNGRTVPTANAVLVSHDWEIARQDRIVLPSWRHRSSTKWGAACPTSALQVAVRRAGVSPANATPITVVSTQFGCDYGGVEQALNMLELVRALRRSDNRRGSAPHSESLMSRGVLPSRLVLCGDMAVTSASWAMALAAALGLVDTATRGWSGALGCGCAASSSGPFPLWRRARLLVNAAGAIKVVSTSVTSAPDGEQNQPVVARLALPIRPERQRPKRRV